MTTNFTTLPVIDLAPLSGNDGKEPAAAAAGLADIARQLHDVFETVGFAYLVNCPLSFSHDDIFGFTREFFDMPLEEKMSIAKKTFRPGNKNTYRGYDNQPTSSIYSRRHQRRRRNLPSWLG